MTDRERFEQWKAEYGGVAIVAPSYAKVAWDAWHAATAAERERAADVAESMYLGKRGVSEQQNASFEIAAEIRKGE